MAISIKVFVWNQSYFGLGRVDGVKGDTNGDFAPPIVGGPNVGAAREFFVVRSF